MRKFWSAVTLAVFLFLSPVAAGAETFLVPGGQAVGLQLRDDRLTVVAYDEACTAARDAGVKIGDVLEKINDTPVTSPQQVQKALENGGKTLSVTLNRKGKLVNLAVKPDDSGRLGIYLRQGISGIGTVTFFDPAMATFAALGHGVSDTRGNLLKLRSGNAYPVAIRELKIGKAGDPGQLKGEGDAGQILGKLTRNTPQGIFGQWEGSFSGTPIPTAASEELHTGPATIRCTLDDTGVQEYSVEILKIYPESRADGRNLLLKVTDETLLQKTGGVIQGMSGSPIIQDEKLIGAVTHVLVNDPTTGYGIFIENMLDAAG